MARPVPPLRPISCASLYRVSFLYFEFGEMEVQCEESLTVIDHNTVAFEIEEARQQHGA